MADIERSVLDAISPPQFAGGVGEVSRIVQNAAARTSWPRLLEYARRWEESAVVKRLGYPLDIQADPSMLRLARLCGRSFVPPYRIFFGGRERWGTAGKLAAEWGIIENVPRDVLVDRREGARRSLHLLERVG